MSEIMSHQDQYFSKEKFKKESKTTMTQMKMTEEGKVITNSSAKLNRLL